jgi:Domain of unknown function DUF29
MTKATYDTDFYAWTQQQAQALAAKDWSALDLDHLMEEIESLGSEQEHPIESHLTNLLLHLLKWRYQPERRGQSWRRSALNVRVTIGKRLRRNPSLTSRLPAYLVDAYADARNLAAVNTALPRTTFPDTCPWTLAQVLDEDFWPGEEG